MKRILTTTFARDLEDYLTTVANGEHIFLHRHGKDVAVVIPFEMWEDWIDSQDADRAIAEMEASGEKPIPWEEVKARLDAAKPERPTMKTRKKRQAVPHIQKASARVHAL